LAHYRPLYKDGVLYSTEKEIDKSRETRHGICMRDIEITYYTYRYSFGLELTIEIKVQEGIPKS
jgi:hypothetical protein